MVRASFIKIVILKKLEAIAKKLNFNIQEMNTKKWKGSREYIIEFIGIKN